MIFYCNTYCNRSVAVDVAVVRSQGPGRSVVAAVGPQQRDHPGERLAESSEPLLFVGDDFTHTDLRPARRSGGLA